jgi:hypothetical protein
LYDEATLAATKWKNVKLDCRTRGLHHSHYEELSQVIARIVAAGKFDDRSPKLKETFGGIERTNIMTLLGKLAKSTDYDLHADYQWLCNIVYSSVGNMLGDPAFHELGKVFGDWRNREGRPGAEGCHLGECCRAVGCNFNHPAPLSLGRPGANKSENFAIDVHKGCRVY